MDEFPILVADGGNVLLLIGFAWLAILGMLVWGVAAELWHLVRGRERTLFVHRLERHGLTLAEAVQAEGYDSLARALDRCVHCRDQRACRHALRFGWLGARAPRCPNAALFAHAREARKIGKPEAAT